MNKEYYFQGHNFVIENYAEKSAFSDFLPGIAGLDGRPLWAFYCNRGQGISGFGVHGKENAIMEFSPAEIAYEVAPRSGFRTFLTINGDFCEPFAVLGKNKTEMQIYRSGFAIEERSAKYEIRVEYCGVPHKDYAALARVVTYTNVSQTQQQIEVLDGLARMLPHGMSNNDFKRTGNLLKSWACVEGVEDGFAFMRMRSSSADTAQVSDISGGNFFVAKSDCGNADIIVDPYLVFGEDKTKTQPIAYIKNGLSQKTLSEQSCENEFACAFAHVYASVMPNQSFTVTELIGFAENVECVRGISQSLTVEAVRGMLTQANNVAEQIAAVADTHTANPLWDEYIRQSYFDNVLRGGMPVAVGDKICYVYSRKHGDPERDYNDFVVEPQAYSGGNGNFRDVAQNRRNDVFFTPACGDVNIKYFFSLLQLDGYNPLTLLGSRFTYVKSVPQKYAEIAEFLHGEFTVGELCRKIGTTDEDVLADILGGCKTVYKASFGEGYWTDHFVYLIDLVESYLAVYPDKEQELLYGMPLKWYSSCARVLPMREKTVLRSDGEVRRYDSVRKCEESGWVTTSSGEYYKTCLAAKLLFLVTIKLATLDPIGAGIDMEADKPGWNDATSGLPAVFGSNVADAMELLRLVEICKKFFANGGVIEWCGEQNELFVKLSELLRTVTDPREFYFKSNRIKEEYRDKIYRSVGDARERVTADTATEFLTLAAKRISGGLERAKALGGSELYPTYLRFEVTDYERVSKDSDCVYPKAFCAHALPVFAESVAKGLSLGKRELYQAAKKSALYDKDLGVFRTGEPLDGESLEIGRIRSFPVGWLERESCFLHMHYKVLLSLLQAGLYDEFYNEMRTGFVPNMDPERYGRSTVENSSFIVTANHGDKKKHGKGFQARLTGANAEVLSMWRIIMGIDKPFTMKNGQLEFVLSPVLPNSFFDCNGQVSFTLFGTTKITYTDCGIGGKYRTKPTEYKLVGNGTQQVVTEVVGSLAEQVRAGKFKEIEVKLK